MPAIDINRWMIALFDQLQRNRQRHLLCLQGSQSWCDSQFQQLLERDSSMLVFSNRKLTPGSIEFSKADGCLGGESRSVVVDLFEGLNPDVLCIAAGLVRAGGVLLLLSPSMKDWDPANDRFARWQDHQVSAAPRFAQYFFERLTQTGAVATILNDDFQNTPIPVAATLEPTSIDQGQTAEQTGCLQRIEAWLRLDKAGVVLVSAERGRGKSTVLGLLMQRLQTDYRILVTASSRQSAAALFAQAPAAEFVAPDHLLQTCPEADLLIVDEAAMIPLSMLRQLQRLYPRLVLATTAGGYEGTGQGFMLRFVAELDERNLLQIQLQNPVRWCQGDQLERWLDQTLILNADTDPTQPTLSDMSTLELEVITNPGNAGDFSMLRQVYVLLNSAHYRTRPSDLRMLMENPDLVLIVARADDRVIGAVLLNLEGGFDDDLCREVFLGNRRPRGHLLAQMLTAQAGIELFASYRGARVQRIAVLESCRRRGVGRRLLEHALAFSRRQTLDYIGASFALDPQIAGFWQQAGYRLVHVSYAQGKSSGNHSVAVLQPLNSALDIDLGTLQRRIQQQLPTWMTQFLQTMDADQVAVLLRYAGFRADIDKCAQRDVESFAHGNRGFEFCFASLQKFVMQCVAQTDIACDSLLIEKAVQNRNWNLLERESGEDGRKRLQKRLRGQVEGLLKAC